MVAERRKLYVQPHDLVRWPSMYPGYEAHNRRIDRILSGELVYEDQEEKVCMPDQPKIQMPSRWFKTISGLHVNIFCPRCGGSYLSPPSDIGFKTKCHDCNILIDITRPSSDAIHEPTITVQPEYQGLQKKAPITDICHFCASPCSPIAPVCPSCGRTPSGTIGRIG